ncbi:uncharacterized protein LOC141903715 [Tubulanus polymorphus]|uniref:uncharacterized protein LOC141903715 n=1 Tax=Tubulanus polymorphus TaxID=672921 RepID=UPI003DA44FF8
MADLSLDDYIKRKKFSGFKNRPLPVNKKNGQKSAFKYSPVTVSRQKQQQQGAGVRNIKSKFNAKKLAAKITSTGSIKNRLGAKGKQNGAGGQGKNLNLITKKNIDARVKITNKNLGKMTDARQKILAKTKFADARVKIVNNLAAKKTNKPKIVSPKKQQRPTSAPGGVTIPKITIKNTITSRNTSAPATGRPNLITIQPTTNIGSITRTIPVNRRAQSVLSRTIAGTLNKSKNGASSSIGQISRTVPSATKPSQMGILSRSALRSQPTSGLYSSMTASPAQQTLFSRTIGNNSSTFTDEMDAESYSPKENFVITRPVSQQQTNIASSRGDVVDPGFSPLIRIQNDQYMEPAPAAKQPPLVTTRTHKAAVKELKKPEDEDVVIISPLQGFKVLVTNLHPIVTQDDIMELFSALGPLRKGRLVKKGVAEIVFHTKEHALMSVKKYNNRELDGLPMTVRMVTPINAQIPDDHIEGLAKQIKPSSDLKPLEYMELDMAAVQKALFKVTAARTANTPSPKPVSFTVKI